MYPKSNGISLRVRGRILRIIIFIRLFVVLHVEFRDTGLIKIHDKDLGFRVLGLGM